MKLHLVDTNPFVVDAWRASFAAHQEVDIRCDSILEFATHTAVSPANSHGFMDGGIDLVYLRYFGGTLQEDVREAASRRPEGFIPVGSAELVRTQNYRISHLIIAPTMEMPEAVPAANAGRAFSAVLRLLDKHPEIPDVCCPGMCTGVGLVTPEASAREMEGAYSDWKAKHQKSRTSASSQ